MAAISGHVLFIDPRLVIYSGNKSKYDAEGLFATDASNYTNSFCDLNSIKSVIGNRKMTTISTMKENSKQPRSRSFSVNMPFTMGMILKIQKWKLQSIRNCQMSTYLNYSMNELECLFRFYERVIPTH